MKEFLAVLKFELESYFHKKGYILTTIIISLVMIVGLSLPAFIDTSKIIPGISQDENTKNENVEEVKDKEDISKFAIYDEGNVISNIEEIEKQWPDSEWRVESSKAEVEKQVKDGVVEAGFVVKTLTDYNYFVKDTGFSDANQMHFEEILRKIYQKNTIEKAGLNYEEIDAIYKTSINSEMVVLGKDGSKNFFYTYILLFVIYMMVLTYGQLVAVSVTTEKSNRAIEVLVTSTSSNSLIFGKVIAATLVSFMQVGVILASGVVTYAINREAWNGILDSVFNIPAEVLIIFALFGVLGYLFYAFIFGVLGALVSKTEDISSSIGPFVMIFVIVFFIAIFGLNSSDSIIVKIASYIPFSSPMVMLVRASMGTVSVVEIAISLLILIASTVLVGIIGSKIYRMATLMYGNPIKLKNAFKLLKKSSNK